MNVVYNTSTIQAETKGGLNKYWRGDVVESGGKYYTRAVYWQDKKDGTYSEIQESALYEVLPTNVGRSNERSGKEQAIFNIDSDFRKQLDKGYYLPGQKPVSLPLPMLAHKYSERKHSLGNRLCVQPKLDGCRALMKDGVFWTRMGKLFIPEVVEHLKFSTNGVILDGELMLPHPYTFQDTMTAIKKFRENSKLLVYHVFDTVDTESHFGGRHQDVLNIVEKARKTSIENVVAVPTYSVSNEEDMMEMHSRFCQAGFEGTMVRDLDSKYLIGHRSEFLLKHKDFMDEEFKIVDVTDGLGKEEGCAIFTCITSDGKTFDCRPRGTQEYRMGIYNNKEEYVGKMLTVKFQGYTDEGSLRFPVGIAIRDYE